jgi:hypothetical protein
MRYGWLEEITSSVDQAARVAIHRWTSDILLWLAGCPGMSEDRPQGLRFGLID